MVAGASGGLGAPISRRLADAGARLTLVGRDESTLHALGIDGATVVAADLRKAGTAGSVVDEVVNAQQRLDGVVVASGVVAFGSAVDTPDEVLVDLFTTNTLIPIRLLKAAAAQLSTSADEGRDPFFCTVSAVVAEQPMAGMAGYSASKAALAAFDAAASRELRRTGIRVLDARPPHTETGLAERPIFGKAPRLPEGLSADAVAARIVQAIVDDERDLPSSAFVE